MATPIYPGDSRMTPELRRFLEDEAKRKKSPLPVTAPSKNELLRARVVAVTEYPMNRCRAMARAPLYGDGVIEAEFVSEVGVIPVGIAVQLSHAGVTGSFGAFTDYTWPVQRWAKGAYGVLSPMHDDSGLPVETRKWITDRARDVGLIAEVLHRDFPDGTHVWITKLETGRGATEHIKMPGESWREVCDALGLGWPT